MTIAKTPAELELLTIADPFRVLREAQSACVVLSQSETPEWRETYLRILRPWWESATVDEMAWWLTRLASSSPRRGWLRIIIRLCCLVARCMDLLGDNEAARGLERIETWASGSDSPDDFTPYDYGDHGNGYAYRAALENLEEAIFHRKWRGDVTDFFDHAYHASNGEDFAPLIRAALPLEELVP